MDYILLFLCLLPFPAILLSNELLDKYFSWPREIHRKYGHVLSGVAIIVATYFLNREEMLVFAGVLLVGALATRILKFKSIHQITRKTIGTTLYPVALLVLVYIWLPNNTELVRYGILILTIPDALAAVFGSIWGKQIPKYNKSLLGSVVFLLGTIFVTSLLIQDLWAILTIAVTLTVVEFFSQWGIDNLSLPLLGSWLLFVLV